MRTINTFVISNAQGFNARKVISEVYAPFVLQCTVTGGNIITRRMAWDPSFTYIINEIFLS